MERGLNRKFRDLSSSSDILINFMALGESLDLSGPYFCKMEASKEMNSNFSGSFSILGTSCSHPQDYCQREDARDYEVPGKYGLKFS